MDARLTNRALTPRFAGLRHLILLHFVLVEFLKAEDRDAVEAVDPVARPDGWMAKLGSVSFLACQSRS